MLTTCVMVKVKLLVVREILCNYDGKISYGGLFFFSSSEHYNEMATKLNWKKENKLGHVWCEQPTEWTECLVGENDYKRFLNGQFLAPELVYFSGLNIDTVYELGRDDGDQLLTA